MCISQIQRNRTTEAKIQAKNGYPAKVDIIFAVVLWPRIQDTVDGKGKKKEIISILPNIYKHCA